MNINPLIAGWPFAILLMLYVRCIGRAPLSGTVRGKHQQGRILVLERDGTMHPVQVEVETLICGMDGYPVSFDAVHLGDQVEIMGGRAEVIGGDAEVEVAG